MRVRTDCLVASFVAGALLLGAARADLEHDIRLGARWEKGERRRLELVQTFERSRKGVAARKGAITRYADLEVLEASGSGFVVRWSFAEARTAQPLAQLPVEEWVQLLTGVQVEVETDRPGDFNGIRNWREAGAQARDASERLLEANPDVVDADRVEFRRLVRALFAEKGTVEAFFARDIRLCTFMLGWYLAPGKPEQYPDYLSNPFGGEPFPSRATLLLRKYDAGTGRADLRWWRNLNVEEATRILRASAEAEARRNGKPPPAEATVFHIGDRADIVLDNKTGWLQTLRNERTTVLRQGMDEMRELRTLRITDRTR